MKNTIVFGMEILRKFYYLIVWSLVSVGVTVFAANSPITTKQQVIDFFNNTAETVQKIFWAVAIIAIFYSGFLYATAGGNEQRVDKAKKSLLYGVIAVAIGVMAFGIEPLVRSFLGGAGGGGAGGAGGGGGGGALK